MRSEIGDPHSRNQINIAIETDDEVFYNEDNNYDGGNGNNDDDDDNLSEIDILQESLPSSKLRRVKSVAKPGKFCYISYVVLTNIWV